MKRRGKYFCFCLAVLWILFLSGCGEAVTVFIDGAEVQTTETEEKHWISVEELQDYGFVLQKGEKAADSQDTNWMLYPLAPDMKLAEKENCALEDDGGRHHVYCNGVWIPTKIMNGKLMLSVESLAGEEIEQSYLTYRGVWENADHLQQMRYSIYLVEKTEKTAYEWELCPLRPTMPLRTPWGCIFFEKVLTDEIPFTKESFSKTYVCLPEFAEHMGFSFVLHKGILHMRQEEGMAAYEVPVEGVSQDFLERRLISGYMLTGEGIRIGCVYDGQKLYAKLDDLKNVLMGAGYNYETETRTFRKKS